MLVILLYSTFCVPRATLGPGVTSSRGILPTTLRGDIITTSLEENAEAQKLNICSRPKSYEMKVGNQQRAPSSKAVIWSKG